MGKRKKTDVSRTLEVNIDPYHPQRPYTVSVGVAGTVLDNAISPQRKAYLAGQIARALAIFNVDEVIVFNDKGSPSDSYGCSLLVLLLQYLECPQYLKKSLFSLEPDLQYAGMIPPLCLPHHFMKTDISTYRDGVTTKIPGMVDVGLTKLVQCDLLLQEGIRVTVKIQNPESVSTKQILRGTLVSPNEPRKKSGVYWGYKVRVVESINQLFDKSEYDLIIGTSDKGKPISKLEVLNFGKPFSKLLIVFGGVDGLESATEFEDDDENSFLARFHHYINTRPSQGTKTIRTEEAIPISLMALEPLLHKAILSNKKHKKVI